MTKGSKSDKREALNALGYMDAKAAPALSAVIGVLKEKQPGVQMDAAWVLGRIGPKAASAIPLLCRAYQPKAPEPFRRNIIRSFGQIGSRTPCAVKALLEGTRDKSSRIQYAAITALGKLKASDASVLKRLAQLLRGEDKDLSSTAADALGHIGVKALPLLSGLLTSKKPHLRSAALLGIGIMQKHGAPSFEKVHRVFVRETNPKIKAEALRTLREIGEGKSNKVKALSLAATRHKAKEVRKSAVENLGYIKATQATLSALRRALVRDEAIAVQAAKSLGRLGKAAAPVLRSVLRQASPPPYAIEAVGYLGTHGVPLLPALVPFLGHQKVILHNYATSTLKQFGPLAAPVVKALGKVVLKGTPAAQKSAMDILSAIGPKAQGALPQLQKVARGKALQAQAKKTIEAIKAIPRMIRHLGGSDTSVKIAVAVMLGKLGAKSVAALPALRKALQEQAVKPYAQEAIEAIVKANKELHRTPHL